MINYDIDEKQHIIKKNSGFETTKQMHDESDAHHIIHFIFIPIIISYLSIQK